MTKGQNRAAEKSDDEIAAEVARMLHAEGHAIPVTESEVERFEKQMDTAESTLSPALLDVDAVFAIVSGKGRKILKLSQPVNNEVEQLLARAAREGGQISPDVEKKMRADRKRAEADCNDGKKP